jgi:hypothetical protein
MPNDVLGSDERVRVAKSVRPPVVGRDPQRSNSTSIQRKPLNSASEGDSDPIGASLLGHITVTELLDADERPTFIIDLEPGKHIARTPEDAFRQRGTSLNAWAVG